MSRRWSAAQNQTKATRYRNRGTGRSRRLERPTRRRRRGHLRAARREDRREPIETPATARRGATAERWQKSEAETVPAPKKIPGATRQARRRRWRSYQRQPLPRGRGWWRRSRPPALGERRMPEPAHVIRSEEHT